MKGILFFGAFFFAGFCIQAQTVPTKTVRIADVTEYELQALNTINTFKTEFAAVPYDNGIVFVSEQKNDLITFENLDPSGNPFLDLFYSEKKGNEYSKRHSFSQKYNSAFHDGPISFNKDYTKAFLTRASSINKRDQNFTNQSKLYLLEKKGNGWGKPRLFPFDSDKYSLGHASVSEDGRQLFFASDMSGGMGGIDLYVSEWTGTDWGTPKNLGPEVNSPGNELYPFIRKDGVLFYASSKLGGFGGLDIYSASFHANKWVTERNEGININSTADDFAICFSDSTHGYLSSNREGNDNIYSFSFTKKLIDFDGFVLNSKDVFDPSKHVHVELTDTSGHLISDTETDDSGYFRFRALSSDETYLVRIDESDGDGPKHYYLADRNYNILRVTGKKGDDKFVFKNLPKDKNAIPELDLDDDVSIAGNLFSSQNPAVPLSNAKLVLKDKEGNIIDETTTNSFGSFAFTRIPPDGSYVVEIVESDGALPPGTKITMTNKSGKLIQSVIADKNGKFKVQFLEKDRGELKEMEVADTDLIMDLNPAFYDENDRPIAHMIVLLKDEHYHLVAKDTTDNNGRISFRKLLTDKNYLIEFDESDERLGLFKKIVVKTRQGKIVREIVRSNGKFNYQVLKGTKDELAEIYVDDPWLTVLDFKNSNKEQEVVIEEKVYYAYGDYHLDNAGKRVMQKVLKIMQDNPAITIELSSHTDSQSSAEFNKALSQKRAKEAVNYLVGMGIQKSRLKALGYGESHLKNKCADGVPCTEEEHAQNRRTEFRVINNSQK